MITSRRTFGRLLVTSFLLTAGFAVAGEASANQPLKQPSREATIHSSGSPGGAPSTRSAAKRQRAPSMVAQAATGHWDDGGAAWESPPLADENLQPVGFATPYAPCPPVCDCGACDVACGAEPVCGVDPGCGTEAGCGIEIGCGLGEAIETVRSNRWWNGGCDAGCTDGCCDVACGMEGSYIEDPVCGMDIHGDCSCDGCSDCQTDHIPLCVPILRMNWHSFDLFWGHQGYTGPLNYVSLSNSDPNARSGNGSFGFYQGFNKGSSLKRWLGCNLSGQFGLRATQSNFSGGGFTRERRYQVFLTTGVFRRVDYGLQYGLVLDYLNQDWYFQGDALQLRGELSWRGQSCETYGFQFMAGVRDESSGTVVTDVEGNTLISTIRMEPTDQYRFFYRSPIARGGQWGAFAGWTDHEDAVLGSNLNLHLFPRILLATDVTYMIPKEGRSSGGNEQESWNVAIGLVFRPGGPKWGRSYNLPLLDVADNGSFMIDRR